MSKLLFNPLHTAKHQRTQTSSRMVFLSCWQMSSKPSQTSQCGRIFGTKTLTHTYTHIHTYCSYACITYPSYLFRYHDCDVFEKVTEGVRKNKKKLTKTVQEGKTPPRVAPTHSGAHATFAPTHTHTRTFANELQTKINFHFHSLSS